MGWFAQCCGPAERSGPAAAVTGASVASRLMSEPLIVTFGDVLALSLITPPGRPDAGVVVGRANGADDRRSGRRLRLLGGRGRRPRRGRFRPAPTTAPATSSRPSWPTAASTWKGPGVEGHTGIATVIRTPGARRTALTDRGVCPRPVRRAAAGGVVPGRGRPARERLLPARAPVRWRRRAGMRAGARGRRAAFGRPCLRRHRLPAGARADPRPGSGRRARHRRPGPRDRRHRRPRRPAGDERRRASPPAGRCDGGRRCLRSRLSGGAASGEDADDAADRGRRLAERCGAREGPLP